VPASAGASSSFATRRLVLSIMTTRSGQGRGPTMAPATVEIKIIS
jgi:hypothetical protein